LSERIRFNNKIFIKKVEFEGGGVKESIIKYLLIIKKV